MMESSRGPGVRRAIGLLARRPALVAQDADDELASVLEERVDHLVARGMTPEAARAEAVRRMGGDLEAARARVRHSAARRERAAGLRESVGALAGDVRLALRGMRRAPGFVAIVVACLALGVGANLAAYSLFEELIRRPLPVPAAERLVNLSAPGPKPGTDDCNQAGGCEDVFSLPMFRDLARARGTALAGLAAHRLFRASVAADGGAAAQAEGEFVSGAYFRVLGLRPALGRLLEPGDDVTAGAHPVAVVSHAYWTSQLGGDPGAVGRRLLVNGRPLTIVGVAPPGFQGTTLGMRIAVYVPILQAAAVNPFFGAPAELENRKYHWAYLFGRLRPGATAEQAADELTATYRAVLRDVELPLHAGMSAATRARFLAREIPVEDGRRGQSAMRRGVRVPAVLLLAITGLVVLIACANVAGLLLVRGAGRATEIAVRRSLGAGRGRLVRQLLVEALLLAGAAAVVSLLVAHGLLGLLRSFIPGGASGIGGAFALAVSPPVLLAACAMALATGLLFGIFPALHATRPDLATALRDGAGQVPGGARRVTRFRAGLVTMQIAMSLALLGCAGMFAKSLRNLGRVELGLDAERAVQFGLLPALNGYDVRQAHALLLRVEEELATLPGAQGAAATTLPLLTGSSSGGNVRVTGFARGPDTDADARMMGVGPHFFRTVGIPLVTGRAFGDDDRLGAPKVAVVNEAFVRKFGLARRAVGARVGVDGSSPEGALDVEIVGVVRDARYSGVKEDVPPVLYTPFRQDSTVNAAIFYVRAAGATEQLLRAVPGAVARVDRALPLLMLKPVDEQARESLFLDRMLGTLSAGFAGVATLLAAVGLFGVLAYSVAQRRRELAVRMALGADAGTVRTLVLRQTARLVVVGGAIGLAGALGLGRAARSLLFGLEAHDPLVLGAAALVMVAVALGASWLPARWAARANPAAALRAE